MQIVVEVRNIVVGDLYIDVNRMKVKSLVEIVLNLDPHWQNRKNT